MSLDADFFLQVASVAGQVARFAIDVIQRIRARARAREQQAAGRLLIAVACYGEQCPRPRPWTPWTWGREADRQPRPAGSPCRDVRDPQPVTRRTQRQARRIGIDASWGCRGRVWLRPQGRHRRG